MYAMVAAGLALMLGVARLINFAHGEFFMLGAYAFWYGYRELELPYAVAGLLAPALMIAFGMAYEHTVIRVILPRSWHVQLIATLATSIVLTNLAIIVFGTQPKEVPTALSSRILTVGGFRLAGQRLLVLGASVVIFWALHRFVTRTRAGKAMRAMSQNREACAVVGVDVQQVAMVTFARSRRDWPPSPPPSSRPSSTSFPTWAPGSPSRRSQPSWPAASATSTGPSRRAS